MSVIYLLRSGREIPLTANFHTTRINKNRPFVKQNLTIGEKNAKIAQKRQIAQVALVFIA
jgi:hypothetical protein